MLAARGILWAPDFVVNAGGVIHGVVIDFGGGTVEEAAAAARGIGPRLADIYKQANNTGSTPYAVASRHAHQRVAEANERRGADRS